VAVLAPGLEGAAVFRRSARDPFALGEARHAAEALAAVAKVGQKVCREMPARDWVRGVVVGVEGEHVGVRIDEPGAHAHFPRGDTVWDLARAWTPCW
jgi:hypothetical protein